MSVVSRALVEELCTRYAIDDRIRDCAIEAAAQCETFAYQTQSRVAANVLRAFSEEGVAESDLHGSLGYGYDDAARERYESLLCRIFGAERALARLSFASGTHAIVAALAACVPPGKVLLSVTGAPYDTLRNAIVGAEHSLVSRGIRYAEVDWTQALRGGAPEHARDFESQDVAVVFIQRSRGYAPRTSVDIAHIAQLVNRARAEHPEAIVIVDNCYGELVEEREPTHVGADLAIGSLIKNLGGGIAPGGGYVIGNARAVQRVAEYMYAPGLNAAVGPTLGYGRTLIQGLFIAPLIVEQTLRGLDFAAALFERLGYGVDPRAGEPRTDIVQAIRLRSAENVRNFARSLQTAMPVNARFVPEPGAVPGYVDPVIMSSGAFINGATIELSCDAPMREPFEAYLQGGLHVPHAVLGALVAAQGV